MNMLQHNNNRTHYIAYIYTQEYIQKKYWIKVIKVMRK